MLLLGVGAGGGLGGGTGSEELQVGTGRPHAPVLCQKRRSHGSSFAAAPCGAGQLAGSGVLPLSHAVPAAILLTRINNGAGLTATWGRASPEIAQVSVDDLALGDVLLVGEDPGGARARSVAWVAKLRAVERCTRGRRQAAAAVPAPPHRAPEDSKCPLFAHDLVAVEHGGWLGVRLAFASGRG